jgi:hypothetical protein
MLSQDGRWVTLNTSHRKAVEIRVELALARIAFERGDL